MRNIGILLVMVYVCFLMNIKSGESFGTFGLDIHHRYSDTVKAFLGHDGLPEKDTVDYFTAIAHRDHILKARRLAGGSDGSTPPSSTSFLTFSSGNDTYRLRRLGYLHYSIVNVGTPPVQFIVALDTGSNLFWLPCNCIDCARSVILSSTSSPLELEIYSPTNSSTSSLVPCDSKMCGSTRTCLTRQNACAYAETYRSTNTSSSGILVDDVLRMGTDETSMTLVDAQITLGCGIIQTGDFLNDSAINGLLGLGMDSISVPSVLASKGLIEANSLSMCFGSDGGGRIEFGYKGNPDQKTTPFNVQPSNPSYNVTVTSVAVGTNITNVTFTALFESGITYTHLTQPAYSIITEAFNSLADEPRYRPPTPLIYDYCYNLSETADSYFTPNLVLTMAGGAQFNVTAPTSTFRESPARGGQRIWCLTIIESNDINIIGQNFMEGYRLVFDRDDMVLGWEESDCYDSILSGNTTSRGNSSNTPPRTPSIFGNGSRSPVSTPPPPPTRPINVGSNAPRVSSMSSNIIWMVMISISFRHFIVPYL